MTARVVEAPKGWKCVNPECRMSWVGGYDFDGRSPLCLYCQDEGLTIEYTLLFVHNGRGSSPEDFYYRERAGYVSR